MSLFAVPLDNLLISPEVLFEAILFPVPSTPDGGALIGCVGNAITLPGSSRGTGDASANVEPNVLRTTGSCEESAKPLREKVEGLGALEKWVERLGEFFDAPEGPNPETEGADELRAEEDKTS